MISRKVVHIKDVMKSGLKKKRGIVMASAVINKENAIKRHNINRVEDDPVLMSLKKSGKRLRKLLDIKQEHINDAIEEARQEWT